jgi:hypothetical protein
LETEGDKASNANNKASNANNKANEIDKANKADN